MKDVHIAAHLVVTVLAALVLASASAVGPASAGSVPSSADPPACVVAPGQGERGRALILIQGMFSRDDSEPMWDRLTTELADLYGGFIYFSYSGRAHDYSAADTFDSITSHDLPLLSQLIDSCRQQGWTSFDLIGHSKGGMIATEYIKANGFTGGQAGLVRNVITLDAPVNGTEFVWLIAHGPAADYPAPWWGAEVPGGAGVLEMAQMYEERERVRRLNREAALQLQQTGGCLLTLTNDQDVIISRADALIDGFGKSYDLGADLHGDTGRRLGHHQILDVPNETTELQDIRDCLTGRLAGASLPAQPLPGLQESFVDFVSDAAHQLVLLLPVTR